MMIRALLALWIANATHFLSSSRMLLTEERREKRTEEGDSKTAGPCGAAVGCSQSAVFGGGGCGRTVAVSGISAAAIGSETADVGARATEPSIVMKPA